MYTTQQPKESERSIFVAGLKPRNKHLNDVLLSCNGGKMKNKKDKTRQQLKIELRKEFQ